jgi:hypothetical protein
MTPTREEAPMPEPLDESSTLTDEEIETRPIGGADAELRAADDTGDDTGDDSGDEDDGGDPSDTSDTGDDSGDDSGDDA